MGLVKTRRLARHSLRSACSRPYGLRTPARGGYAMQKQQRAKAGTKPPAMKCGAKKDDDSFWSRNGRKSERKDSR